MAPDQIAILTASHEKQLAEQIEAAFLSLLAAVDADQIAAALDDVDAIHIREQLGIVLDLDEPPEAALGPSGALLASFVAAIAALAAAQANHNLAASSTALAKAQASALSFVQGFLADTRAAIVTATDAAIFGPGTPEARAAQLKRSIGLTMTQGAALDSMHAALQRFLAIPRALTPSRIDTNGVRIKPAYTRQADTRAILAATRGRISASQSRILAKALSNADLTQADADRILDRHAAALRDFRVRAASAQAIHGLAETAKLTGWRIAQSFGALPAGQRRYWQTAGDERVRHAHAEVPTMNPKGVLLDQPFATPFGARMNAPLEWGCRCKAVLGAVR